MAKLKICQINDLIIRQVLDFAPSNLPRKDFYVYTPQGKFIESFQKLEDAKDFCQKAEDFVKRKRKIVFTFSELCDAASGTGWWDEKSKIRDEARGQAEAEMIARGVVSQENSDDGKVTEEDVLSLIHI